MKDAALHNRIHDSLRDALIRRACARRTITYSELAQRVGLPLNPYILARRLPALLNEISAAEDEEDWPLLGALVVRKTDGRPGAGFFRLARRLGRLPADADRAAERAFFEKERQRVHAVWAD